MILSVPSIGQVAFKRYSGTGRDCLQKTEESIMVKTKPSSAMDPLKYPMRRNYWFRNVYICTYTLSRILSCSDGIVG